MHNKSSQIFNAGRHWTLFLDRDGVINRRIEGGYVLTPDQFEFLPGVPEAIARFSKVFGRIVVVSNQQGIGKGLMTVNDLDTIHKTLIAQVTSAGGRIDAIYHAPNLSTKWSFQRKPAIGMALKAKKEFPEVNFKQSIMAGDTLSDMRFGRRAGMFTVLISDDLSLARQHPSLIDLRFPDLSTFASHF